MPEFSNGWNSDVKILHGIKKKLLFEGVFVVVVVIPVVLVVAQKNTVK